MNTGRQGVTRQLNRSVKALLFLGASGILVGCAYDPVYYGPPAYPPYYPDYYDYYYYPSVGVYFHFTSGYYYYRDRNHWVRTRALPPNIHIDYKDRVKLRVDSELPYNKYPQHRKEYQPKPNYRGDEEHNQKEREANRRWYQEYEQKRDKRDRDDKDRDKDKSRDKRDR